mmetsp:Transcript_17653/g.35957  ORF Transcript_17653/g.35957 Transcript_17653/m.35957 type:complete len:384 (+) Transcript_17653:3154-4305(+)
MKPRRLQPNILAIRTNLASLHDQFPRLGRLPRRFLHPRRGDPSRAVLGIGVPDGFEEHPGLVDVAHFGCRGDFGVGETSEVSFGVDDRLAGDGVGHFVEGHGHNGGARFSKAGEIGSESGGCGSGGSFVDLGGACQFVGASGGGIGVGFGSRFQQGIGQRGEDIFSSLLFVSQTVIPDIWNGRPFLLRDICQLLFQLPKLISDGRPPSLGATASILRIVVFPPLGTHSLVDRIVNSIGLVVVVVELLVFPTEQRSFHDAPRSGGAAVVVPPYVRRRPSPGAGDVSYGSLTEQRLRWLHFLLLLLLLLHLLHGQLGGPQLGGPTARPAERGRGRCEGVAIVSGGGGAGWTAGGGADVGAGDKAGGSAAEAGDVASGGLGCWPEG